MASISRKLMPRRRMANRKASKSAKSVPTPHKPRRGMYCAFVIIDQHAPALRTAMLATSDTPVALQ